MALFINAMEIHGTSDGVPWQIRWKLKFPSKMDNFPWLSMEMSSSSMTFHLFSMDYHGNLLIRMENLGTGQLWKLGNYDVMSAILDFSWKRKQHFITQDIHMYLHIKFHPDRTIFEQVRILAGNTLYVWRHIRHFENRRTSNLKRDGNQPKLNLLVKTQCLYH